MIAKVDSISLIYLTKYIHVKPCASSPTNGDDHAHDVPDITAMVRKIRNQFDGKCRQRERYEAPDKGPIAVLAMLRLI
jgi:hypothetical protein